MFTQHSWTPHDRKQHPILRLLKDKILNNGVSLVNTANTRYTHPERIVSQTIHKTGDSDHYMGEFIINSITKPSHPRYILTRNWKSINWENFKFNLANDPILDPINKMTNPHKICESIQSLLNHHLENNAPISKYLPSIQGREGGPAQVWGFGNMY